MNIDKALTWHKLYTVLCNRFNVAQRCYKSRFNVIYQPL